uniref:KIB1-4 beta-propeller domain-containing protein n=1 Tax=Hordeum vulgare subsp. vulgare TaxID=112509 RepID=A0A8I6XYB7_HORVV
MAAQEEQPDWLNLPSDLLTIIARRSRDAVTGLTAFRSVCRAWRAASGPAPRLLLPRPRAARLVFPLSRGWSIVFHVRDASCHISHLSTGATAALPALNAFRDAGSDVVRHARYVDCNDVDTSVGNQWMFTNYLDFTDCLRFAVHLPPGPPAATGIGMTVMMYHMMHREAGMFFSRPGDAAWTKVGKPTNHLGHGYFDLAYHDGKMFGMHSNNYHMSVFDAATLRTLQVVGCPPATIMFANKMYGIGTELENFNYVHLVALPTKLVLVRTTIKSYRPVAFCIFELVSGLDGQLAWRMVIDAGNYELFLDGYHATFKENDGTNGSGTWIYYIHDRPWNSSTAACCYNNRYQCGMVAGCYKNRSECGTAVYCYSMQDNKLECVYKSTPKDDGPPAFSTKPSWFIP